MILIRKLNFNFSFITVGYDRVKHVSLYVTLSIRTMPNTGQQCWLPSGCFQNYRWISASVGGFKQASHPYVL